ncbi:protein-glutamate methylesterase/protein-glutamine glutaminase [Alkalicoccobacillus gibsonii]|uniref:protein-glutamate methylesterase/protein-glutamine glutaminase n=1 Tax=Alkalicoccobacillus gibsonii TaxID=79881 RepID=UPI00193219B0|nr:chemotaxis response regulator protein-glutamate methylesterase [Alkalicoccobacillus gibsonii]MBM0065137.1 chemotaxis response regulator protein-glutamate methylesterase [Alkalicoccobacillus gibsonii]
MNQIRVLVVDDSAFMRKVVTDILQADPQICVVGTARNGEDATRKNIKLKPDVITMDVEMPVLDGLGALKQIMIERPIPVVMVSSLTSIGAHTTMLAMEAGAVDFVAKTSGSISLDLFTIADLLRDKIKLAAQATVRQTNVSEPVQHNSLNLSSLLRKPKERKLVAIGVSTGGPKALKDVLTRIPRNIAAPIVIVQHMPEGFTKSLADRLDSLSDIQVVEANDGDVLEDGTAYIAPGGKHLKVKSVGGQWICTLSTDPAVNGHRPSVDVLYQSISLIAEASVIAVIMTGMGADGSEGLKQLKTNRLCYAFAQSEETSVVYGMPKMAVRTGKIDKVVHLQDLANQILAHC